MKKRIVSIIVVMALLATLLTGCNLITLNAERDGGQVVSSVDVDGLQGIVTKADLVGFFNQLGYLYIQYGMEPEKIITDFVTQLSNKEILSLYATKVITADKKISFDEVKKATNAYVANEKLKGRPSQYDSSIRPFDLFKVFTPSEQYYVIDQANKSLEQNYKTILEEVKNEFAANNADDEEDKEEKPEEDKKDEEPLAPRKTRPLTPKTEYEEDPSITTPIKDADTFAKSFFAEMDAKVKAKTLDEAEVEAYNRLQKNLNKIYKDSKTAWNVILDGQKEYRLMNKYRDEYINKGIAATEEEILSRYKFTLNGDIERVKDDAAYKTAFEGDQNNDLLVHNNKTGYFMVKSILLKFSKDQEDALKAIKNGIMCDTDNKVGISIARDHLARDPEFALSGMSQKVGGIKVNISNPNYDPKAECDSKDCKCKCAESKDGKKDPNCKCKDCPKAAYNELNVPFDEVLKRMSLGLKSAENIILPKDVADDPAKAAAARLNAKMDAFTDWIYLVNDDPGMFDKAGYAVSNKGESSFVAEYVALARALKDNAIKNNINPVGVVGGLGEITVKNPIQKEDADIAIHSFVTEGGEEINYIVNDFGIHIVMVTYVPAEDELLTSKIDGKDNLYKMNYDYVVKYANEYVTDEDGKIVYAKDEKGELIKDANGNPVKQLKALKNQTVKDKLADKITNEKKDKNYAEKEEEYTKKYESKIVRNEKLINSVIKEIEDSLKAQGYDPHHGHNHNH